MTTFVKFMFIAFGFRCVFGLYDITDKSAPRVMRGVMAWIVFGFDLGVTAWAAWLLWGSE